MVAILIWLSFWQSCSTSCCLLCWNQMGSADCLDSLQLLCWCRHCSWGQQVCKNPLLEHRLGGFIFFVLTALIPKPVCPLLHEQSSQRGRKWKICVSSNVSLTYLEPEEYQTTCEFWLICYLLNMSQPAYVSYLGRGLRSGWEQKSKNMQCFT